MSAVRFRRAAIAAALASLFVLSLVACAPSDAAQEPVATTEVHLPKSYRFDPAAITVPAGAIVTWTNDDNFTHNVTFEGDAPLTMSPGTATTRMFDTPGRYAYQCTLHPQDKQGTVDVTDS